MSEDANTGEAQIIPFEKVVADSKHSQALADQLLSHVAMVAQQIGAQREEILTAFVAKYGFQPDEATQINERDPETHKDKWFVVRLDPDTVARVTRAIIISRFGSRMTRWQRFCLMLAGYFRVKKEAK